MVYLRVSAVSAVAEKVLANLESRQFKIVVSARWQPGLSSLNTTLIKSVSVIMLNASCSSNVSCFHFHYLISTDMRITSMILAKKISNTCQMSLAF